MQELVNGSRSRELPISDMASMTPGATSQVVTAYVHEVFGLSMGNGQTIAECTLTYRNERIFTPNLLNRPRAARHGDGGLRRSAALLVPASCARDHPGREKCNLAGLVERQHVHNARQALRDAEGICGARHLMISAPDAERG